MRAYDNKITINDQAVLVGLLAQWVAAPSKTPTSHVKAHSLVLDALYFRSIFLSMCLGTAGNDVNTWVPYTRVEDSDGILPPVLLA